MSYLEHVWIIEAPQPSFVLDRVLVRISIAADMTLLRMLSVTYCAKRSHKALYPREPSCVKDLNGIEANATKSVVTDMMQDAAQSLLQLVGAKGYRLDHIAGRATVDSRPFQIFEGSNDILYQQISEAVLKLMRQAKETNLLQFLRGYDLTARASDYLKGLLDFEVDLKIPQRKLVNLGKALGRIVTMEMVLKLGDRGFRSDLIANGLSMLQHEVTGLLSTYQAESRILAVNDYERDGSWLALVTR